MNVKTYNIELQMTEATRNHWMSLLAQTRDAFNACAHPIVRSLMALWQATKSLA